MTVEEMAEVLEINRQRVKIWNRHGLIRGHAYNAKNDCLYAHPGENPPGKAMGLNLSKRRPAAEVVAQGLADGAAEGAGLREDGAPVGGDVEEGGLQRHRASGRREKVFLPVRRKRS